jgi:hypothetical protein
MAEFVISSCLRDYGHNAHFGAISVMQCCWKEEVFAVFRKENRRSVRKQKRRTYYFDNALGSGFKLE